MSTIKKLASQTAIYGLSTMVGRLINYLLVPLYTAYLAEVADYGVVGVMFGWASLFSVVFGLGLETAYFHFSQKTGNAPKVFSTAVNFLIITGFIWVIIACWFAPEIMTGIGYPNHPEYALWFITILSIDAITAIGFAKLRQEKKPWKFALIKLTNIFINVGANLFFLILIPVLASNGISWAVKWNSSVNQVSWIFISNLIASGITLPLLYKSMMQIRLGLDLKLLKTMLKYSYPLIFIGLAGMINETFDRILLKKLLPEFNADYEVSIYNAFYKLSLVLTLFVQAFRFAVEPFFFEQSKKLDAQESYAYIMKYFVYVVSFIFVFTVAIIPYIAPLLIRNPDYFLHPNGMKIVPILLAANLFLGVYYTLSVWYKVSGNTRIGAIPAIVGAILTIALNYVLIPKIGFVGSAITTLAAYTSMVIVGYFLSRKFYPIPYNLALILTVIGIAFMMGFWINTLPIVSYGIVIRILIPLTFALFVYLLDKKIISNVTNKSHQQKQ